MEDTTTVVATTLEVEAVEPTVAVEAAAEVVVEAVEAAVAAVVAEVAAVAEAAVVVVAVAAEIYPNNYFYISDLRSLYRFKNKNRLYDLD